jgi:hypothetical protein
MTALDYRREGYDIYSFGTEQARLDFRAVLLTTGEEYDMKDVDEVVCHTDMKFLAVKRTSKTFKQRIAEREKAQGNFTKGD